MGKYRRVRFDDLMAFKKRMMTPGPKCSINSPLKPRNLGWAIDGADRHRNLRREYPLIVHRLINERDREVVEKAAGDIDRSAAELLPTLAPGEADRNQSRCSSSDVPEDRPAEI